MKTVIDAVNELKGDYNCKDVSDTCDQIIVAMKNFHGHSVGDIEVGSGHRYDGRGSWRAICTFNEFLATVAECETNFGESYSYSNYKTEFNYINSINSKPAQIFTQEMADNGVFPSVGMGVMFKHGGYDIQGTVTAITKEFIVLTDEWGKERIRKLSESPIKPITPPVPLDDGEAYQFYIDSLVIKGIYRKMDNKFYNYNGDFGVGYCTNIQPLTVEVK